MCEELNDGLREKIDFVCWRKKEAMWMGETQKKEVNKRLRDLNVFNCSVYGHCLNMTSSSSSFSGEDPSGGGFHDACQKLMKCLLSSTPRDVAFKLVA